MADQRTLRIYLCLPFRLDLDDGDYDIPGAEGVTVERLSLSNNHHLFVTRHVRTGRLEAQVVPNSETARLSELRKGSASYEIPVHTLVWYDFPLGVTRGGRVRSVVRRKLCCAEQLAMNATNRMIDAYRCFSLGGRLGAYRVTELNCRMGWCLTTDDGPSTAISLGSGPQALSSTLTDKERERVARHLRSGHVPFAEDRLMGDAYSAFLRGEYCAAITAAVTALESAVAYWFADTFMENGLDERTAHERADKISRMGIAAKLKLVRSLEPSLDPVLTSVPGAVSDRNKIAHRPDEVRLDPTTTEAHLSLIHKAIDALHNVTHPLLKLQKRLALRRDSEDALKLSLDATLGLLKGPWWIDAITWQVAGTMDQQAKETARAEPFELRQEWLPEMFRLLRQTVENATSDLAERGLKVQASDTSITIRCSEGTRAPS